MPEDIHLFFSGRDQKSNLVALKRHNVDMPILVDDKEQLAWSPTHQQYNTQ